MTPAYEHNGRAVSAPEFYAIACDPRRHVAVEACAGAGKTWMLVSRILRALLEGAEPQEILAITFTKRAAGEMRERLQQWLEEYSTADSARLREELLMRGLTTEAGAGVDMQSRLANLNATVLATGQPVQIRTFHAWFATLLRNAPYGVLVQLGLPSIYELLEDDKAAKAQVWRRFYAALIANEALRADFEAVVLDYGRFQAERALQAALDKRLEFAMADAAGVVDDSVTHFSQQLAGFAGLQEPHNALANSPANMQICRGAAAALGRADAPSFSAMGVELEQALGPPSGQLPGQPDVPAVLAALLTKTGTARKFSEKIEGIERVREAQALALRILQAQRQHAAWVYQQRMGRLSRLLIAEYAALKRERGWIDMNDVERAASLILCDPVLSGWLQQRLDARIRHVMVDEFQDTSPLQWQALFSWLSAYGGSGAGAAPSVFIVGDPKQSIYRFRRAEPQVFKAAKAFVQQELGGDLLSCDHTRRNALAVIHTVNAVMQAAMRGDIEGDVYDGFRQHTTSSGEAGEVLRLPQISRASGDLSSTERDHGAWRDSLTVPQTEVEDSLRMREARQAAQWIAVQVAQGTLPKNIMVLSRRRASLAPLHDALRALQVPSQIGEKTALIECAEVQDLVALFDVLVSSRHDLSMARVLKSPLFGVDDAALVQLALQQQAQGGSWLGLLLGGQTAAALQPIGPVLLQWRLWVNALPPHDALQAIYSHGDVLARYAAAAPSAQRAAVLANLRALPGAALQQDGGRFATPYGFVRALKAGRVQAAAAVVDDAVQLLTIHGAKGLEAELVVLLDSDANPPRAESMGVLIDWPGESPRPLKFVFLASEKLPPACAESLLARDMQERKREELNALYVALTRGKTRLVLSSVQAHRASPGSWWTRLAELAKTVEVPPIQSFTGVTGIAVITGEHVDATSPANAAAPDAPILLKVLPRLPAALAQLGSQEIRGGEGAQSIDETSAEAPREPDSRLSRVGQAMHRLLEWHAQRQTQGHAQGRAQSHAEGPQAQTDLQVAAMREFDLTLEDGQVAAEAAQRILNGEGAWAWDDAVIDWQGNEVELVHNGVTLRLDRLVRRRDNGAWWILDHKLTSNPLADAALVQQLRRYRAAVQAIYPDAPIHAAFLTADGKLVELQAVWAIETTTESG